MGTLNKLVIPTASGFKTPYLTPQTMDLFDGDDLVFVVDRSNYTASNPITKEVVTGFGCAVVDRKIDYYEFEALVTDDREYIKDILEALVAIGNLDTAGITFPYGTFDEKHIIVRDYHRFDTASDRAQGYTERVGVLNPEDIKGSFRAFSDDNHNKGLNFFFTHTHNIVGSSLVDAITGL